MIPIKHLLKSFLNISISICFCFCFMLCSCKKLIEVEAPITSLTSDNVFNSDETAISVLTGLYNDMSAKSNYINNGVATISGYAALSADELSLFSGQTNAVRSAYYRNSLMSTTSGIQFWNIIYPYIYTCNSAIEAISGSSSLTPEVKQQLLGESKFMRAFYYFYLTNLYGDVPLVLTKDYTVNSILPRFSKSRIYDQIILDLKDAQQLLNSGYVKADAVSLYSNSSAERIRPNKGAATALLARVYLYMQDYSNAELSSSEIINNKSQYDTVSLSKVFLKNSKEAIWQLQPVNKGWNTEDARFFIIPTSGLSNTNPVYLSTFLFNRFDTNDLRKTIWVGKRMTGVNTFYFPNKYKINTLNSAVDEYLMVLRIGEQYLIRAEARAQQGNINGAKSDLNVVRTRSGLPNTDANDKPSLLLAILNERQLELFTEWGHRWFDLKRTESADAVMSTVCLQKGGTWSSNWLLYPLPLADIQRNSNLIQNQGY